MAGSLEEGEDRPQEEGWVGHWYRGGLDLPAIIVAAGVAAVDAATQVYVAAASASPYVAVTAPSARVLSPLKWLHLRFICGVGTATEIPRIWLEVCQAPTKAAAMSVLSQYLWTGR